MADEGFAVHAEDYSLSDQNPSGGFTVTNIHFTNNKFSTVHYGCVGSFGLRFARGKPHDKWNRSGNIVLETRENEDKGNLHNKVALAIKLLALLRTH